MISVEVDNDNLKPVQVDWELTYNSHLTRLGGIPVVASGGVSQEAAEKWLGTISKLYPSPYVNRAIGQVSGIGAKDIRTLVAAERGEYFPSDSAGELYKRKFLNSVATPNTPSIEKERILTNIVRSLLVRKYGLERDLTTENSMSMPSSNRNLPWLVGKPGLVGVNGAETFLFDVQITDTAEELNQGDLIRLHHYDLVANNAGKKADYLNLVKVTVDPEFSDSLVAISRISKDAEKSLSGLGGDFANLPEDKFNLTVHQIEKQPALYKEIIAAGQKHWKHILSGNAPGKNVDPPLYVDEKHKEIYIEKAKEFLVATQALKAADKARKKSIDAFVGSMSELDISDNFSPPYEGVLLRKHDYFNAAEAAEYMENNLGVDPAHLKSHKVNVEMLEQAFVKMGGDITKYFEYVSPDKKMIETAAEQIDFDLSDFYTRKMKVIVSAKTRGPVFDAIKVIGDSVSEKMDVMNKQVVSSAIMDDDNLISSERPVKQKHMNI